MDGADQGQVPSSQARTDPHRVPSEVPFPRYMVGLLQSESEMLQAPEFDLSSFLQADPRWDYELYTERNVAALVESANRFDCIVVGYNAAHASAQIRNALERELPRVGLCLLHQFRPDAVRFLRGEVGLRLALVSHDGATVAAAEQLDPREEILLNWPAAVSFERPAVAPGSDGSPGELRYSIAHSGLMPAPGTRWRTVLETSVGSRRMPALVRTETRRWPPLVVSTALLSPRHGAHAALLANMILWCASGRPSAVVVDAPWLSEAADPAALHRKMRLQGSKAIAHRISDERELDFDRWPFRGITNVVVPAALDPTQKPGWPEDDPHHASRWLSRGGSIAVLGPADELTLRHGESDAHWVAARWATWFNSASPASWHGGAGGGGDVGATRAVLRLLAALQVDDSRIDNVPGVRSIREVRARLEERDHPIDPAALGLPPTITYLEPVRGLLLRRIGGSGSVDGTVSVTVAALDIDTLLERQALGAKRERLESWLSRSFADAALEDKLEIARVMADEQKLHEGLEEARGGGRLKDPPSAVLVTALRNAVVACDPDPGSINPALVDRPEVIKRDLHMSPLLAANYLVALNQLNIHWRERPGGQRHPMARPSEETVDRAVISIGRDEPLLRGDPDAGEVAPEMVSDEALALIAYFGRHHAPTHLIGDVGLVPPQMLTSVLRESEALRRENEERVKDELTVARAASILLVGGLLLALGVIGSLWALIAAQIEAPLLVEIPIVVGALTLATLALLAGLNRLRLLSPRGRRLAGLLRGGALRERLTRSAEHADEQPG